MSLATSSVNNNASVTFDQYCAAQKNGDEQIINHKEQIKNNKEQILDKIESTRGSILDKLSKEDIINCEKLCKVENILIDHPPKSWGRIVGEITLVALGTLLLIGGGIFIAKGIGAAIGLLSMPAMALPFPAFGQTAQNIAVVAALKFITFLTVGVTGIFAGGACSIPVINSIVRGVNLLKQASLKKSLGEEKLELFNQLVKLSNDQIKYKGYSSSIEYKTILPNYPKFEHKTSYHILNGSVYTKPANLT